MDIAALQSFANINQFDLTQPLNNRQVQLLARQWLPEMRFYEDERYHPISLREMVEMVESQFAALPAASQDEFRVHKLIKQGGSTVSLSSFDPPLLTVPDGTGPGGIDTVRVLTASSTALAAMEDVDVGTSARLTHGASETRSRRFFAGTETVQGGDVPSAQDPLVPRARTNDGTTPRITVVASYKNLLETLEYNLVTEEDEDYPADALRTGFEVVREILRPGQVPVSDSWLRQVLLARIAAHKAGDPMPPLPPGIRLDKRAWDALTRFAFIEYSFYYAYNDFERYQTAIWDNEHEGDDEGCCMVFDRNLINLAASVGTDEALLMVQPHSLITSVHKEYTQADRIKIFPTPTTPTVTPEELRDTIDPIVWIAGGSHATYLSAGTHDLVDFGDYLGYSNENVPFLLSPLVLPVAIILHILEHFVDTEDFTSDDGVRTGPGTNPGSDPLAVAFRLQVLPMSGDNHIYQSENRDLLTVSAFPGHLGGHDGVVDESPRCRPKTGRYFRKLLGKVG